MAWLRLLALTVCFTAVGYAARASSGSGLSGDEPLFDASVHLGKIIAHTRNFDKKYVRTWGPC